MYTQVSFKQFLDLVFARYPDIDFKESPNPNAGWKDGDWGFELDGFNVDVFRWPPSLRGSIRVNGPMWDDKTETRESFEPRFEADFKAAIEKLRSH